MTGLEILSNLCDILQSKPNKCLLVLILEVSQALSVNGELYSANEDYIYVLILPPEGLEPQQQKLDEALEGPSSPASDVPLDLVTAQEKEVNTPAGRILRQILKRQEADPLGDDSSIAEEVDFPLF